MQYVPFYKLVLGRIQYLVAGDCRVYGQQRQDILELVPESESSAGLEETRAAPNPAGKGLVKHPAVQDEVCCRFRGMYLYGS